MSARQHTISKETRWIEGQSIDQGASARVRFLPADDDVGIIFRRVDVASAVEIRTCHENVRQMPRWTALEESGAWVHHTEHILAAVRLAEVDNIVIEVDGEHVPILQGGCARLFFDELQHAGRVAQASARRSYVLRSPFYYADDVNTKGEAKVSSRLAEGRYIASFPSDSFHVSYVFDWAHVPSLPVGFVEYDDGDRAMRSALLDARSYLVGDEYESLQNVIGPFRKHLMWIRPGSESAIGREAARHKIIDFVGDMMTAGHAVRGMFFAFRTGHRIHLDFLRQLIAARALVLEEA